MTKHLLAIGLALALSNAAAANRCVIEGKVVFQDAPCPGSLGTIGADIKRRAAQSAEVRQEKAEREARELQRQREADDLNRMLDPCKGVNFDDRLETYLKANPGHRSAAIKVMNTGEPYIGMPEEMLMVFVCGTVEKRNVTKTALGENVQLVFGERKILLAKYIYLRNGVVYAVQQ